MNYLKSGNARRPRPSFSSIVTTWMISIVIILVIQPSCVCAMDPLYTGERLSEEQLKKILSEHEEWTECIRAKESNDPSRNCGSQPGKKANLSGADLKQRPLNNRNLREADFFAADLQEAFFYDSDLRGAIFASADLTGADFVRAKLKGANFSRANLDSVKFDILGEQLPNIDQIAQAINLHKMTFEQSPIGLYSLRNAFKDAGYRKQEREITYAIKHAEIRRPAMFKSGKYIANSIFDQKWTFLGLVNYVLIEFPCEWGMSPLKPLLIIAILIIPFAFFYAVSGFTSGQSGIWVTHDRNSFIKKNGGEWTLIKRSYPRFYFYPLYFSIMSAFNMGFGDKNISVWIQRLQPSEFKLSASGWIRVTCGVQALVSYYLLALSILTYFDRPFQ